ncbi:hypothetical protein DD922_14205, partial [Staphylococcus pseudintermedius]
MDRVGRYQEFECRNLYRRQHLGYDVVVSRDPAVIERAEQLILPGVGHFKDAMQAIDRYELAPLLKRQQKPIIGICLG